MMNKSQTWAVSACFFLAACGGGSDSPSGTSYPFVAPTAGASSTFATAIVDDSNNTINGTYVDSVLSVNTDGSFVVQQDDPTNTFVTVNGITYGTTPETIDFGNDGLETSYVENPSGSATTCTETVTSGGRPLPLRVGDSWSRNYTVACADESAISYVQNASVMSSEMVTVAAGTFAALKIQGTIAWTTPSGQMITNSYIRWIDPNDAFSTLKEIDTRSHSGNVPLHYIVSETTELQTRN